MQKSGSQKEGFTLAEVLITLVIIGVIAGLTIPALIQNIQDAQYKVAYRKAYSVASQAWQSAVTDNLIKSRSNPTSDWANLDNFLTFQSKFHVVQVCNNNNNSLCWNPEETWDGAFPQQASYAFIDSSGMAWTLPVNNHPFIFVDTNGLKGPNKWGKYRFPFIANNHQYSAKSSYPFFDATNIITGIVPDQIQKWPDTSVVSGHCPSGSCYYTSWLLN